MPLKSMLNFSPAAESFSHVRILVNDPDISVDWVSFSPDGKLVLFSRSIDMTSPAELFVVPVEGGVPRRLFDSPLPVSAIRTSWSADGRIAFNTLSAKGESSIWIVNADGTDAHELVLKTGTANLFYPTWYPDGDQLAVVDIEKHVIKRIDLAQGTVVDLTDSSQILAGKPSISPDGEWLAFAGQRNSGGRLIQGNNSLWVMNNRGELQQLEPGSPFGRHPNWSPDGQRLAFDSNRGGPTGSSAAFIINRDGSGLTQITDYSMNVHRPVWSPDGTRLVVSIDTEGPGPWGIALLELNQ